MSSDQSFVDYTIEQMTGAGEITFRKMFGEYAIYSDGKVVALVCDNQLFVKQTVGGRTLLKTVAEAPPYPGAKPHFLIDEQLENADLLKQLIRVTATELPAPKPKKTKTKTKSASPSKKQKPSLNS